MDNARLLLSNLRQLREQEQHYADKAVEYLARASDGMGAKRATDTGGAGDCPLSTWTDRYSLAKDALVDRRKRANEIWARIEPLLGDADFDAVSLIALYYNQAMSWEDTRDQLKRSEAACQRMHREMVQRLDGLL